MNTCSAENRTWRYQTPQNAATKPRIRVQVRGRYINPGVPIFDEQFESQLPPEVRAELELPPRAINRWPERIPETEEEIQQAIAWLKAQGFLQEPNPPAPPPQVPIRTAPVSPPARPAQSASRRGTGIWWLLATLIGLPLLLSRMADKTPPQSRPVEVRRALPAVEVRRALPAVPRALPVTSANTVSNAQWQPIRMPDGTIVNVSYQGELPSSAALPPQGHFIGEAYSTGTISWVWMTPAGASFPSWVDP